MKTGPWGGAVIDPMKNDFTLTFVASELNSLVVEQRESARVRVNNNKTSAGRSRSPGSRVSREKTWCTTSSVQSPDNTQPEGNARPNLTNGFYGFPQAAHSMPVNTQTSPVSLTDIAQASAAAAVTAAAHAANVSAVTSNAFPFQPSSSASNDSRIEKEHPFNAMSLLPLSGTFVGGVIPVYLPQAVPNVKLLSATPSGSTMRGKSSHTTNPESGTSLSDKTKIKIRGKKQNIRREISKSRSNSPLASEKFLGRQSSESSVGQTNLNNKVSDVKTGLMESSNEAVFWSENNVVGEKSLPTVKKTGDSVILKDPIRKAQERGFFHL